MLTLTNIKYLLTAFYHCQTDSLYGLFNHLLGTRDGRVGMVPSNVTQVRFWPAAIRCWSLLALALLRGFFSE